MGAFADLFNAEIAALVRDMQRDRLAWLINPPVVISQRKILSRISISGEIMDEFAGTGALAQYDGPLQTKSAMARMPTLKERINLAVASAQDRLKQVREAQEIFDRNPDLEKLLDIMQKNHF